MLHILNKANKNQKHKSKATNGNESDEDSWETDDEEEI